MYFFEFKTNLDRFSLAMNRSSNSTANLPHATIIWSGYIRATISFIGVTASLVNMLVFTNQKLNERPYKFMLGKSIANFFYLSITFTNEFVVNCVDCLFSLAYANTFYTIAVNVYILGALSIYRILVELMVVTHTYSILINKNWLRQSPSAFILIMLAIISLLFNLQKVFMFEIIRLGDYFYPKETRFGESNVNKYILIVQTLIKIFLTSVLFPIVNVRSMILFKRRFKNRVFGGVASNQINLTCKINTFYYFHFLLLLIFLDLLILYF